VREYVSLRLLARLDRTQSEPFCGWGFLPRKTPNSHIAEGRKRLSAPVHLGLDEMEVLVY